MYGASDARNDPRPHVALCSLDSIVGSSLPPLRIELVHDDLIHSCCHAEMFVHLEHIPVAFIEVSRKTHCAEIKISTL